MDLALRWRALAGGIARTAPVLLLAAACSSGPGVVAGAGVPDPGTSGAVLVGDTGQPSAPRVELRSRVTRVAGQLSDVRRERVARQARATVRDYLEGAFAAADHGPFDRFQAGLRRTARGDERVLASTGTAGQVRVTHAAAWFSVAAPGGRPVGVTARLRVELAGPSGSLTGRLLLTRSDGEWQVFGYDLARSEPARDAQ
jgi:hypothetical protein